MLGLCLPEVLPPGPPLLTIGVPPFYAFDDVSVAAADRATLRLRSALKGTGLFRIVEARHAAAAGDELFTAAGLDRQAWSAAGAFATLAGTLRQAGDHVSKIDLLLFEMETGRIVPMSADVAPIAAALLDKAIDALANRVVLLYTGRPGLLGTRIAFSRRVANGVKEIYTIDAGGGQAQAVTRNGSLNLLPAWSREGALAWTSYRGGNPDIYLNDRKFASHGSLNTGAAFAPDGRTVAASVMGDDGNANLVLLDRQTGALLKTLTHWPSIEVSPAWSADGRRLAFVSDRLGQPQIYVMDLQAATTERVPQVGSYNTNPCWSPTGNVIVYNSMQGGGRFAIFAIDLDAGSVRRLTHGPGSQEDPYFSPDGRQIVYSERRDGQQHLWVMAADGSARRQLTRDADLDSTPAWSPPDLSESPAALNPAAGR